MSEPLVLGLHGERGRKRSKRAMPGMADIKVVVITLGASSIKPDSFMITLRRRRNACRETRCRCTQQKRLDT